MPTVAIVSQKGGVGKTVTTVNLGAFLNHLGYRVLVVDTDSSSTVAGNYGLQKPDDQPELIEALHGRVPLGDLVLETASDGLDIVCCDLSIDDHSLRVIKRPEDALKRALKPLMARYDWVLIDTPPTLDMVAFNAINAADWIIVPTDVDYEGLRLAFRTIQTAYEYCELRPEITDPVRFCKVVVTMDDHRDRSVNGDFEQALPTLKNPAFQTRIRRATAYKKARNRRTSLLHFALADGTPQEKADAQSAREAFRNFEDFVKEVLEYQAALSEPRLEHSQPLTN